MSNLKLDIDINELAKEFGEIKKEVATALQKGAEALASMTHAKVNELATDQLNTRAETYKENVTFEEVEQGVWVVTLLNPAMWIEEGKKPGSMVDDLLQNNPKTNKDGKRYKAIPFQHNKRPSQMGPKAQETINKIKAEMKARKIPIRKIELGADGSPRVGLLHRFSIESEYPSKNAKSQKLENVAIYQSKDKNTGNIRKDIMTFRIVHEDHKEEGKWVHPGTVPAKIFEQAFDWSLRQWENSIMPDILKSFDKK